MLKLLMVSDGADTTWTNLNLTIVGRNLALLYVPTNMPSTTDQMKAWHNNHPCIQQRILC